MSGCSTSASTVVQDPNHQVSVLDCSNLFEASEHCELQHENEVEEEKKSEDGNAIEDVAEEEDEDEDVDFNPLLKETNSLEASSSLSSEVEDLDADVADSRGKHSAVVGEKYEEKNQDTGGNVENGEEMVMQTAVSSGKECGNTSDPTYSLFNDKESALINQFDNGSLFEKESGFTNLADISYDTDSRKSLGDIDADGAISMRTRARYSLASFTLDELETFLQETDDEDDLQNVDDEEEYRKFLAAVLRGDDTQNLQENPNADDEDEENDADFELELEEALESDPEEVEERRITRRNRSQKASQERCKKLSGKLNRPLRPLLPFASIGSFSALDGKHLTPNISSLYMPNGYSCGFTPHQMGQLHCLIHEHVQLLIQVFSVSALEPGKSHIASEVKELAVQMLHKRDQALAWRKVPHPTFCFFPPYIHPSVSDATQSMLPSKDGNKSAHQKFSRGSNNDLHSDIVSMSNEGQTYLPDKQASCSQTPECTSWVPYICGPVLSVMDVAPLRLVESYFNDVSSAILTYKRYRLEHGFETPCQKEPLFLHNSPCSAESDGQGEAENTPPDSSMALFPSSRNRMPKKSMAATLLEKAKNQPVAPVPKEIAVLAQRFWPLFNPALFPHKPPPAPLVNRVLFTDAEDELLALGLMEYNTDWKAIQQRFLPGKSRHQIFVRQKNRASSKALENPIKAVRRMKNSPLTLEEIARIELGLKKFKLDFMSVWRFFLPYRDPSLLPRQWRIASGTQKSYKSDATKKAKRRFYELRRKTSKPSSNWHLPSEKEGDSSDNAVEETNSGDNHIDKEDEAYLHEAFLADWMPESNTFSRFPTCLPPQEGLEPPIRSEPSATLRPSNSQVILRPYRARKPNNARMVKLAPDLPPVNLPPSVRVMSQSAFKSSQAVTSAKVSGNVLRFSGLMAENRTLHGGNNMHSGVGSSVKSGEMRNNPINVTSSSQQHNHSDVTTSKLILERFDSDLQMHPLLFQAPQEGQLPYCPSSTSTSGSFTFFSGKQPQLSLSLFHNPRHIRDAVNFLSKSSKPPEKNAATAGVEFHPLLQRSDDVDAHPAGRLPSNAASKQACRNPSSLSNKPSVALGKKTSSHSGLDLNMHPSFTSKNRESGNTTESGTSRSLKSEKDSSKKRDCGPDGFSNALNSNDIPLVTSRNRDEPLPEIVMEQEELSDSEEEFGENVEFECEEMADSEAESTSDSERNVNMPSEEVDLDQTDADINDYGRNASEACSIGLDAVENVKPNALTLNLNSCPPVSQYSNPSNAAAYDFGTTGTLLPNPFLVDSKDRMQKRKDKDGDTLRRNPRKRVCRSNIVDNSKNVTDIR